jgi:7-carboxy-7-deazaguanine synthase
VTYTVHELFFTLQGEGANAGRAAVFVRFAGCNLWTGREQDRASAVCRFCDTEFVGGEKYETPVALADAAHSLWPFPTSTRAHDPLVVLTGGEPTLQVDEALVRQLQSRGFEVAMESNGTRVGPTVDWLTVSPKAGAPLAVTRADELKLVYPQAGAEPELYGRFYCERRYLSPMEPQLDSVAIADAIKRHADQWRANKSAAARYCLEHPEWRLSLQLHKEVGLP